MSGEGLEPKHVAYTAHRASLGVVFAQYGAQSDDPSVAWDGARRLAGLFEGPDGPDQLDRGEYRDPAGATNVVWLAYWLDPERHDMWGQRREAEWSALATNMSTGYWREVAAIPADRMETLHTHLGVEYGTSGLSQRVDLEVTPCHEYWGSARDRIPAAQYESLAATSATLAAAPPVECVHQRDVQIPANLCLIRTAQDWSQSTTNRQIFLDHVKPVMDRGVDYLSQHPESGCVHARNLDEQDRNGSPLPRASTVAWFRSLDHLLAWAKDHPTHHAIHSAFFDMLTAGAGELDVALWHEVSVLPEGSVAADYLNCHSRTGLLPLARA